MGWIECYNGLRRRLWPSTRSLLEPERAGKIADDVGLPGLPTGELHQPRLCRPGH